MPGTITRWDPLAELAELRTRLEGLFEDAERRGHNWSPAVDMVRDNGHLVIRADIPGIKPEEITIEVDEGVLTVSGKHEETKEETDEHFVRRERRYGAFSRRVPLPEGVDPKKIKAKTKDGVLEVTVPLPKEVAKQEPVKITPTTDRRARRHEPGRHGRRPGRAPVSSPPPPQPSSRPPSTTICAPVM